MEYSKTLLRIKDIRYRFLNFLLFIFFCTVLFQNLQYAVGGIRIMGYQIAGIIFLLFFWSNKFISPRSVLTKKQDVLPLIILYLLMILGAAISSVGVITMVGTFTQFLKGFLELLFFNIFLISLIMYLAENKYSDAYKFLHFLLIMAGLSCVYQFFAIYFMLSAGVSLDDLIFPNLVNSDRGDQSEMLIGLNETTGFRHGGFLVSPNTMATLTICVVPITYYLANIKTMWLLTLVLIFIISLLAGLSLSGWLGMAVTLLTMLLLAERRSLKKFVFSFGLLLSLTTLIVMIDWWLDSNIILGFVDILEYRFMNTNYLESTRYEGTMAGLDLFSKSPIFGSGINSSTLLLQDYPIFSLVGGSIHNYWLELFVSVGLFAIPTVAYYLFFLFRSRTLKNIYYKALFVSLCGLIVNGFFHSSIAKPGIQAFLVLLYLCAIAHQKHVRNKHF